MYLFIGTINDEQFLWGGETQIEALTQLQEFYLKKYKKPIKSSDISCAYTHTANDINLLGWRDG